MFREGNCFAAQLIRVGGRREVNTGSITCVCVIIHRAEVRTSTQSFLLKTAFSHMLKE